MGAGEMALAHAGSPDSDLSTHMATYQLSVISHLASEPSFYLCQPQEQHSSKKNTHTHKIKINNQTIFLKRLMLALFI